MNIKFLALTIPLFLSSISLTVGAESIDSKIENQGNSSYVKVVGLQAKEKNGFLTLQLEIANSDYKPRKIYYRVKWLDETGFQVWEDEPWKPSLVQGSARQNIQVSAPTPKARDFRVQFNAEENRPNDPTDPN